MSDKITLIGSDIIRLKLGLASTRPDCKSAPQWGWGVMDAGGVLGRGHLSGMDKTCSVQNST